MVGWHYRLNGHEFEQALGVGNGQGSLVCCSPWCHKESDTTDWTKYLGWENRNIVAQRISQVQPRRWWQGELARPNGLCCLKVGDKLGRKSLGANLAVSPKCCYKGSISPSVLLCRSAGAHPGGCHELITRAMLQQLRLLGSQPSESSHFVVKVCWIYKVGKERCHGMIFSLTWTWVFCFMLFGYVVWEVGWLCSAGLDVWGGDVKGVSKASMW